MPNRKEFSKSGLCVALCLVLSNRFFTSIMHSLNTPPLHPESHHRARHSQIEYLCYSNVICQQPAFQLQLRSNHFLPIYGWHISMEIFDEAWDEDIFADSEEDGAAQELVSGYELEQGLRLMNLIDH
jgi:hypothetical protein